MAKTVRLEKIMAAALELLKCELIVNECLFKNYVTIKGWTWSAYTQVGCGI